MAFPLIPALIGAAAGAAVTYYLITNKNARQRLADAAQDMGDTVQTGADKLTKTVTDTVDDASKVVKDAAAQAKDTVEKIGN